MITVCLFPVQKWFIFTVHLQSVQSYVVNDSCASVIYLHIVPFVRRLCFWCVCLPVRVCRYSKSNEKAFMYLTLGKFQIIVRTAEKKILNF